jgi:drug/metabolite transporter (DMT)-like permease
MNTTQQSGRRAAVIVVAVVGAALVWAVTTLAGVDLRVTSGADTRTVGLTSVLVVALLAGLGALVVALLIGRSRRPRRMWPAVSVPILVVSLVGPLGAATAAAGVALASMHVVVGAILISGMSGSLPARRVEAGPATAASEQERPVR